MDGEDTLRKEPGNFRTIDWRVIILARVDEVAQVGVEEESIDAQIRPEAAIGPGRGAQRPALHQLQVIEQIRLAEHVPRQGPRDRRHRGPRRRRLPGRSNLRQFGRANEAVTAGKVAAMNDIAQRNFRSLSGGGAPSRIRGR